MHSINDTAKLLSIRYGQLVEFLQENKIFDKNKMPLQKFIDRNYFRINHRTFTHPVTGIKHYAVVVVTERGVSWIEKKLSEYEQC